MRAPSESAVASCENVFAGYSSSIDFACEAAVGGTRLYGYAIEGCAKVASSRSVAAIGTQIRANAPRGGWNWFSLGSSSIVHAHETLTASPRIIAKKKAIAGICKSKS